MPHHDWTTQRIICRAVLQGRTDATFAEHAVSVEDQVVYRRMAEEALTSVIRRRSSAKRYFTARIRNPISLIALLAVVIAATSLFMAAYLWRQVDLTDPGTYSMVGSVAGFSAIAAAATGWMISGWVTHRTGRSKLTMDVVSSRFSQPAFGDALTAFNKTLINKQIDTAVVERLERSGDEDDRRALQGLRYLLNFSEFIAVGVLEGELDQRIVSKTLQGTLTYVHDHAFLYISDLQRRDPRILEHFTILRRHYAEL